MPTHHPSDEMLMDYASGSLTEAPALLVATHLALCPQCRARVSALEALGGVLLEELAPAPLGTDCLDAVLARLDEPEPQDHRPQPRPAAHPAAGGGVPPRLPEPLRSYAGGDVREISWRRLARGMEEHDLPVAGPGLKARLYQIGPGVVVPRHTHGRTELVLVLEGAFSDERGRFARGDVAVSDHTVDHAPVADPDGACLCLAVIEGPLRLTGPIGRWLNPFVRM
jgi:putative transcriptional regulator